MEKIYARQIPPECQESPLYWDGMPDNITILGGRNYQTCETEEYTAVRETYDEAAEALEALDNGGSWQGWTTKAEIISEYFPRSEYRPGGMQWSTKTIHDVAEILRKYGTSDYFDGTVYIDLLTVLTGHIWAAAGLNGCCQGDYITVVFRPDEWSQEALEALEIEYFNLGTEWIIHDGPETPEAPDDISGYDIYCYTDDVAREIADNIGADPADVVLYEYAGTRPAWRLVD